MMILHVKVAIISESHKVLAGSLESEGDDGTSFNWHSIMHYEFIPEGEEVHQRSTKMCLPIYGKHLEMWVAKDRVLPAQTATCQVWCFRTHPTHSLDLVLCSV
jgi:hypothetical protein